MKLGFALPQVGHLAAPDTLITAARTAEDLGYDSLWVLERLLWPVAPKAPYPVTPDGSLPEEYKNVLDPMGTLFFVAAHTSRIGLGTSVLDMPYHNPLMLAREVASLDVVSNGRVKMGMGLGWSPDEVEAAGATMAGRGARADEFLDALRAMWGSDPVEYHGRYYNIAKSFVGPKPVQQPCPDVYLAAYAPAALERIARKADGWNPTGIPMAYLQGMFRGIQDVAESIGRDPNELKLVLRANLVITDQPVTGDRFDFVGSMDQIAQDIATAKSLRVSELIFDVQFSPSVRDMYGYLGAMQDLYEVATSVQPAPVAKVEYGTDGFVIEKEPVLV